MRRHLVLRRHRRTAFEHVFAALEQVDHRPPPRRHLRIPVACVDYGTRFAEVFAALEPIEGTVRAHTKRAAETS